MNVALVGMGQMGRAVEAEAKQRDHAIVARFDSDHPFAEATPADLSEADVAIDFSLPDVALTHIRQYCRWQQPAVIGTTGWYDDMDTVRDWVEAEGATLLYAANFSLGVALLRRAVESVLPLLNELPDYDAFLHEVHHTQKVDSPSGTAHMLAELLLGGLDRKTHIETETQHRRIDPEALHVTATRGGTVFGEHEISLDSPYDRVTLAHRAKNRRGFAFGAVRAAEWLVAAPRQGLFSLDDVLADWRGA